MSQPTRRQEVTRRETALTNPPTLTRDNLEMCRAALLVMAMQSARLGKHGREISDECMEADARIADIMARPGTGITVIPF